MMSTVVFETCRGI